MLRLRIMTAQEKKGDGNCNRVCRIPTLNKKRTAYGDRLQALTEMLGLFCIYKICLYVCLCIFDSPANQKRGKIIQALTFPRWGFCIFRK